MEPTREPINRPEILDRGEFRFIFPKELLDQFEGDSMFVIDLHPNGLKRISADLLMRAEFAEHLAKEIQAGTVEVIVRPAAR